MTTFIIGLVAGGSLGIIVMGILAARAYEKGGEDMIETLANRRQVGRPPHPTTADPAKPWTW